jgi:hypothetical protein
VHGEGRSLAAAQFPDDDGTADAAVRARLADQSVSTEVLARELRSARLLATVVAVLDGAGAGDADGDRNGGDKDSHMAVVSMVNQRGERGMLAFSGTDSLHAWNPHARPVPALGRDIAGAAIADGAAAVVVDVLGPHRRVFAGPDLAALAGDEPAPD